MMERRCGVADLRAIHRSYHGARGAGICALLLFPAVAVVDATARGHAVTLTNIHTRERLQLRPGRIPSPSVLNRFFRCKRDRKYTLMDPRLVVLAAASARHFGKRKVQVISAFRTSRQNAAMRAEGRNVALRSRHIHGQALDFRVVGVSTRALCRHLRRLRAGGVGCYARARFVHIDFGRARTWGAYLNKSR